MTSIAIVKTTVVCAPEKKIKEFALLIDKIRQRYHKSSFQFRNSNDLSDMFIAMMNTIQAIVSGAWLPATARDLGAVVVIEIA